MSRAADDVFQVRRGEPIAATLARIADEGCGQLLANLRRGPDDAEAVHEVRKLTKRLRTIARLFRDEVGRKRARRVARGFRDVARALSGRRDAAVRVLALDALVERFDGVVRERGFEPIRRAARAEAVRAGGGASRVPLRALAASVEKARDAMVRWTPRHEGWAAIEPGLVRLHRRGRSLWRAAADDPSVANLHEWRKRVKDLRYAVELLEPLWPEVLRPFAKAVDELADTLGDDHDLAMLVEWLGTRREDEAPALVALAGTARRDLLDEAAALGARIHREPTRAFRRRMATYWDVWARRPGEPDRALRPVIRLVAAGGG
jgi:CHAD domain-containing protein